MSVQNPLSRTDCAEQVNRVLHDFCKSQIIQAGKIDARYARLWQAIDVYLQAGGKRIRPYLMLLAYEAYGGEVTEGAIKVAAAWELLHACLLIHDDIIDRDLTRHGQPNIAGVYEKLYQADLGNETAHYAASAALLAGDVVLAGAHQLVLESGMPAEDIVLVSRQLNDALFSVAGGELLDIEMNMQLVRDANPLKVAKYKTAQYSFEFPLVCGALLADVPEADIARLRAVSLHLGVAFQLTDDLLGVFGDEQVTGKSAHTDIREKKRTVLLQQAFTSLRAEEASRLEDLLAPSHPLTDADAQEMYRTIEQTSAKEAVTHLVLENIAEATKGIADLDIADVYKDDLIALGEKLARRTV